MFLVFSLFFFVWFPCGRLSWLHVSFWAHVNIVYHIIRGRKRIRNRKLRWKGLWSSRLSPRISMMSVDVTRPDWERERARVPCPSPGSATEWRCTNMYNAARLQHTLNIQKIRPCVSEKVPTFKLSETLSNLSRFSKFLHCWKTYEIFYKTYMTLPTRRSACCYTTLGN